MATIDPADSAAALSQLGASKGGKARAARLTSDERSDAARKAAEGRWGRTVLDATHEGELVIGGKRIECAVLDDGTRVLSQGTVLTALSRAPSMGRRDTLGRAPFLSAANLTPFISPELAALDDAVQYRLPNGRGRAVGYRAEILPMVCEVYLAARAEGVLLHNQRDAAQAAEILIRGLARVGVIALVDEATGYQEVRARDELQWILEKYVRAEFRPWLKMFPDEFFEQVYRLQGWDYRPGTSKRNQQVGKLIRHYIYEQLPGGVIEELERLNPAEKGRRPRRHHQHLTSNTGHPHLDKQISTVTTLMRIAHDQREFEILFERAFPPPQRRLPLVIDVLDDQS
ncbi:MAG: P63C domain-containing protein [Acidimicrobiia bacterium]